MTATRVHIDHQDRLNRRDPIARDLSEGDLLAEMIDKHNVLVTRFNALLAKLDADAGITDINYASTVGVVDGAIVALKDRG